jgi:protein-S-isoprenylcysteine O-methyltransferase Ste14
MGSSAAGRAEASGVLIPKTKKEIWLNRVRVWLPPVFVIVAIILRKPEWNLWGIPLVALGESLRTWAAGHLVKDETLTVGGPYAYLRNPLYLGSLLNTIGFLVILGDWLLAAAFFAVALAIYVPTVRQEEDYLRRMHGKAFDAYVGAVPGVLPRLTPAKLDITEVRNSRFQWRWVWENDEHRTWVAFAAVLALFGARSTL